MDQCKLAWNRRRLATIALSHRSWRGREPCPNAAEVSMVTE
jgi:hypothetical protein